LFAENFKHTKTKTKILPMKKIKSALMTAILLLSLATQAQVGIGVSPANINPSAQLDVSSTTKGFLPPRMSETQRNLIASPAAGLTLWCSNCGTAGELQVYNGTAWTNMVGGAATKPVMIGDDYQGGKLAYILQQGDPGYDANVQHGLIAAISDQSTPAASWLNNGVNTITGATATAIGTGLANTNAIILSQGNTGTYAAKICRDYQGGGYTDWFLPSYDELVQLNINRVAIGGFANAVYWSSTETNNFTALWLGFFPSYQYNYNEKYHAYYVRAVRAF
jgi:hypothetical protein